MYVLTEDNLISLNACMGQIQKFREVFPEGAPLTLRSMSLADEKGLSLFWLAHRPMTPGNVLNLLSRNWNTRVRSAVARNSSTLPKTLKALSQDPSNSVRWWVASNHNTPLHILQALKVGDSDLGVRRTAASTLERLGG